MTLAIFLKDENMTWYCNPSTRVVAFGPLRRQADTAEREGAHGVIEESAVAADPGFKGCRRFGSGVFVAPRLQMCACE